jgi:uncharacterized protein (DUF1800 family)
MSKPIFYALNRFGLGAKPGEASSIVDAKKHLLDQLATFDASSQQYALAQTPDDLSAYHAEIRRRSVPTGQMSVEVPAWRSNEWWNYSMTVTQPAGIKKRYEVAVSTNHPFPERLMHFWSNHFACEAGGHMVAHEFYHIRPKMMGYFHDLVISAACQSPAMLDYLTHWNSYGMNSPMGRGRKGMNENLGRELLELYTIGVNGGYTQDDVIELSKALTGYTRNGWVSELAPIAGIRLGKFVFDERMHEPGERVVLGKVYPAGGYEQAESIVKDLCITDSCAEFICYKLARHFISDDPPRWIIDQLKDEWKFTGGWLPAIYKKLVNIFFDNLINTDINQSKKFRDKWDWSVAVSRYLAGAGITNLEPIAFGSNGFALDRTGVWRPGSPAGYPDIKSFVTSEEMFWRLNKFMYIWKNFLTLVGTTMPLDVADVGAATETIVRSISTTNDALSSFFVSPEMTWR